MSDKIRTKTIPEHDILYLPVLPPIPIMSRFTDGAYKANFSRKQHQEATENPLIRRNGERSGFHAENEQKAQAGMAAFLKSPKPHDIQFALPKMCPRL